MKLGEGVTTVVGPNGCGKTNIVDAIRWVLGEQKSRVLRSGKMEDVIFNGADGFKPLNVCQVSLTVHNNSGKLPVEYNDIEIGRRVFRNGESEYTINKTPCRLKDVNDLFLDTGMGADAYSVIELKMIDQILSETGDDRRRMFEEAAGINKYRLQRRSTLRKFEATRFDLERINDIIDEIDPSTIITFSRGYIDYSWELEYNFYNRTNWYADYTTPFLPTPNPPDSDQSIGFLRNSNLPMQIIVDEINASDLELNSYIDINGDPGHYVSEFMAYHGTWYRDLNLVGDNKCISAGHIHVGGQIDVNTAKIATEESIRTLIDYIDSMIYTAGDVNQDNVIDILDLVLIMNNILGSTTLSQIEFYASDMNEDAIINIQDIIIIINIILNNF